MEIMITWLGWGILMVLLFAGAIAMIASSHQEDPNEPVGATFAIMLGHVTGVIGTVALAIGLYIDGSELGWLCTMGALIMLVGVVEYGKRLARKTKLEPAPEEARAF